MTDSDSKSRWRVSAGRRRPDGGAGTICCWLDTNEAAITQAVDWLRCGDGRYFDISVKEEHATMPDEPTAQAQAETAARGANEVAASGTASGCHPRHDSPAAAVSNKHQRCNGPAALSILTLCLLVAGYVHNAGVLWIWGGRLMASDHINAAVHEWPVLAFGVGVLFGANALAWVREYPWMALVAAFFLAHLFYPLR